MFLRRKPRKWQTTISSKAILCYRGLWLKI